MNSKSSTLAINNIKSMSFLVIQPLSSKLSMAKKSIIESMLPSAIARGKGCVNLKVEVQIDFFLFTDRVIRKLNFINLSLVNVAFYNKIMYSDKKKYGH